MLLQNAVATVSTSVLLKPVLWARAMVSDCPRRRASGLPTAGESPPTFGRSWISHGAHFQHSRWHSPYLYCLNCAWQTYFGNVFAAMQLGFYFIDNDGIGEDALLLLVTVIFLGNAGCVCRRTAARRTSVLEKTRIAIWPHVSAQTNPDTAADQLLEPFQQFWLEVNLNTLLISSEATERLFSC